MAGLIGAGAAAWLAALLARARPGLRVADLAALSGGGGLLPWWDGPARWGVADPARLPPGEAALLEGFRHADGAKLLGAAPKDGGLVVLPPGVAPGPFLAGGSMVLSRDVPAAEPAGCRVLLLLGAPAPVERLDLLLPPEAAEAMLAALADAAATLAGVQAGLRAASSRLATLTLLTPAPPAPWRIPGARLPRQEAGQGRLRLLLGTLPAQPLRLVLEGVPPGTALFLDGARIGQAPAATIHPGAAPAVLGLAGDAAPVPACLEIAPC